MPKPDIAEGEKNKQTNENDTVTRVSTAASITSVKDEGTCCQTDKSQQGEEETKVGAHSQPVCRSLTQPSLPAPLPQAALCVSFLLVLHHLSHFFFHQKFLISAGSRSGPSGDCAALWKSSKVPDDSEFTAAMFAILPLSRLNVRKVHQDSMQGPEKEAESETCRSRSGTV